MDYSKLSDLELNKAVHFSLLSNGSIKESYRLSPDDTIDVVKNTWEANDGDNNVIAIMRYAHGGGYNPFGGACDYCNNPADAWPIIVENKLSIYPSGERWGVEGFNADDPFYFDDNPLRAAMIVFLLMQEPAYFQANPARPDIR